MVLPPVLPLNETVPVPAVKVPLFVQFPRMLNVAGATKVAKPFMITLLKFVVLMLVPSSDVDPVNCVVEVPGVNVPLLVKFPPISIVVVGAISVLAGLITIWLNCVVAMLVPVSEELPANVVVPAPTVNAPFTMRLPVRIRFDA